MHLWRFSGGYPALMDCMNKLKNNKVRWRPLGKPLRLLDLAQPVPGAASTTPWDPLRELGGGGWESCSPAALPCPPRPQEYLEFRKERSQMLLSRRNQMLLEFSFWNEPQPRAGPNIYELRTYKLKVPSSRPTPACPARPAI